MTATAVGHGPSCAAPSVRSSRGRARARPAPSRWTRCSIAATDTDGGKVAFPAWESSEGVETWEDAPAPALVAKLMLEAVLGRDVPPRYARLLNNATHWGFGFAAGAGYGLLFGSRRDPSCGTGSRSAPPSGPPDTWFSRCSASTSRSGSTTSRTLGKDVSAHLVFGTATAAAFRLLARRRASAAKKNPQETRHRAPHRGHH